MGSMNGGAGALSLIHICLIATAFLYGRSHAVGDDVIQQVCGQTEDPGFCVNVFRGDPRTPAADMEELCLLSVAITIDHVSETSDKIPGLLSQLTDPVDKQRMTLCQESYGAAATDFQKAWQSSSNKNFPDVLQWALTGKNEIGNCENRYGLPPVRPSPLTADNQNVFKLAGITVVILKMLGVS